MEKKLAEKRKTQRLSISLPVRYRILSKKTKKFDWHETFSYDISGGGMRFRLDTPLEKGERIDTLIRFPDDPKPVNIVSEVAWQKKIQTNNNKQHYDIGLQYVKMKPEEKERFSLLFCEMMVDYFVLSEKEKQRNNQEKMKVYSAATSR